MDQDGAQGWAWGWGCSPLHVPEAVDAEHGLLLSGEHDVGLLVQCCKGWGHWAAWHGTVQRGTAWRGTHGTSCGCLWCAWTGRRSRGERTSWHDASPRGTGRTGAARTCCRSTWCPSPVGGGAAGTHGPIGGPLPVLPAPLPSPPWRSSGRSWHIAHPPRRRQSCPPGTAGAGPRGAAPCPPSPPRGAYGDWDGDGDTRAGQGQ